MISSSLSGSKKFGELNKLAGSLAEFCQVLYCMGIPHHDGYGQITSDPWEWRTNYFRVSNRTEEEFEKAINYLIEVELFEVSQCGKVLLYVNYDNIQTFRKDRPREDCFFGDDWQPRLTNDNQSQQKPKPKKKPKKKPKPKDLEVGFEIFWKVYPKKKKKGDAEKAWKKIKPNNELLQLMLTKIEEAKRCIDWSKDGGQFIPYPASWLNSECWHDEYDQSNHRPLTKAEQINQSNIAAREAAIARRTGSD
jgi:hypothetical protein